MSFGSRFSVMYIYDVHHGNILKVATDHVVRRLERCNEAENDTGKERTEPIILVIERGGKYASSFRLL